MAALSRWDDPLARFAQSYLHAADTLFNLLRSLNESDTSKAELVALRLEQQILTGHRLRKIVERYTKSARGFALQEQLVGDTAWSAVAGQIKAGMGGFLQQLRLDIVCAAAVLMGQVPETAEKLVHDTALSLHTMNCDVLRMINEVARPLLEKAEASVAAAVDVSSFAQKLAGGGSTTTGSVIGGSSHYQQQQQQNNNNHLSSRRSSQSQESGITTMTGVTRSHHQSTGGDNNTTFGLVTLSPGCQEYCDAMRDVADPVLAALSISVRGNERLHRVHIDLLRGLLSNAVLGTVRRHSLLVSAVKSLRELSHKYHRIVQGQEALKVIRESILVSMGVGDSAPEPAGTMDEVDSVGRLLQETMATCNVVREICGLLKQWIVPADQLQHSPQRHAFDHPTAQKTAVASSHLKTNGQYLLQTLRNLSSLLRRVASASEKAVAEWSEPALGSFSRILEIHSAPLLQSARVIANAQTDMKNLAPLVKEKAQLVEEARDIEDTLAVVNAAGLGAGSAGPNHQSDLVYASFENRVRECENLARTIFGLAARSTTVLQEVVTTTCRPIAQGSHYLPCQYVDNEISLLSQSRAQLCQQHESIVTNLKATTTTSASENFINNTSLFGDNNSRSSQSNEHSPNYKKAVLSLDEITSISAQRMSETEQRAIAASCSFDRLYSMLNEADSACDKWFDMNAQSRDPIQLVMASPASAAAAAEDDDDDDGDGKRKKKNNNNSPMSGRSSPVDKKSGGSGKKSSSKKERHSLMNSHDAQLHDDQLATVAPEALLPSYVRNEDRRFTMEVVRGALQHLEAGQERILAVPRPDRVSGPNDLNEFEDDFAVGFVGVEGLCEQVFANSSAGQMFSMPSASSLDVLAKIGAAASPQQQGGGGGFRRGGGGRSPSESSAGGATTTIDATRSLYGRSSAADNSTAGGGANMRRRGQSYVSQNLQETHAARAAMSSPAALALGRSAPGSHSAGGSAAGTPGSSFPASPSFASAVGTQGASAQSPSPATIAAAAAAAASPGLKMRSFTSRAADAMPPHEMAPPGRMF